MSLTVQDVDVNLAHLRAIAKDVTRTVEERRLARRRIDDELDRRNRLTGAQR